MGSATKATFRRSPPASLRTQKGLPRVSPAWRLRTRSCSHDNELYRMGLRKNAAGEWDAIDNLPTAGLAAAMRATRLKSERRTMRRESRSVKRSEVRVQREEKTDLMDVDVDAVVVEEVAEDEDNVIDLTDSTAGFEEIRVYLDIDMEVDGGYLYVDEDGAKVETIMTSVEPMKMECKVEVRTDFKDDMSGDHLSQSKGNRVSLESMVEEIEDEALVSKRSEVNQEQGPRPSEEDNGTSPHPTGPRWQAMRSHDEMIQYLNAGWNSESVSGTLMEREDEEELAEKKIDPWRDYQMRLVRLEQENKRRLREQQVATQGYGIKELKDLGQDPSAFFSRMSSVPSVMGYNTTQAKLAEQRSKQALLTENTTESAIESSANDRQAINNASIHGPVEPVKKSLRRSITPACGHCNKRKIRGSGATGPQGDGGCLNCKKAGIDNYHFDRVETQELHFAEPLNAFSNLGTLPMQYSDAPPNYPPLPSISKIFAGYLPGPGYIG